MPTFATARPTPASLSRRRALTCALTMATLALGVGVGHAEDNSGKHAEDNNGTTLTVYTYESFLAEWAPGPAIKAGFEAECGGCTVEFVALDSSAGIVNRVQLEGSNTRADVVLGLDTNLMAIAEDTGLFAPSGVDTSELELPIAWESDIFVPYDYGYFAFVYDTEALPEPPTSFEALLDAPDDVKIIIQDPRTSTPGLGLLLWMKSVYGDEAAEKWAALQPRILTVTKGWSEAYFSLFLNGEAPMVLSYSTSPAYHMAVDETDRYQAAAFEEGHYLQVEVAALLESSPHKALGREFLAYLHSRKAQESIPLGNVMYPVTDLGDELPEAFGKLIEPRETLLFSPEEVRDRREAWIDEWLEASSR
ncbi:MAG: thiamine ABC transporter substrate binding subunit [Gammaproteobacteria bacterium]|nr:MAG: thiamine ABC transporter substrate binding subunit [Gammaproteobacteria bacterium]PIE36888.1 MAG: thiamine ABC transporter substrate binding subunit [Gammaproteobacteria bacterium]